MLTPPRGGAAPPWPPPSAGFRWPARRSAQCVRSSEPVRFLLDPQDSLSRVSLSLPSLTIARHVSSVSYDPSLVMLTASRPQRGAGPQEGIDHLFLLPERVLGMDSATLRQDLAGLDFNLHLLQTAPQGNVWLAGAAPVDGTSKQNSSTALHSRTPAPKGRVDTLHWFACVGPEPPDPIEFDEDSRDHDDVYWLSAELALLDNEGKDGSSGLSQKEREERLRILRDKQNEERQRKIEELRQQALTAQRYRELKEEERRRRIDELRQRDSDRRQQVEERKRQIWEAERDRREAILRKNQGASPSRSFAPQEREARIDSKRKNERSSIVFAFGSSTPRMLEPADTGGSFWARRATSTTNVMMYNPMPLTRRSSERELDAAAKKRATSAGGLIDRKPGEDMRMSTSMYEVFHWNDTPESPSGPHTPAAAPDSEDSPSAAMSTSMHTYLRVNRRKTDLMPTIPSNRDSLHPRPSTASSSSRTTPFARTPGLRSGEITPTPPSRPLSSLSQQSTGSGSVQLRTRPPQATPRRPRPASIAVTGISGDLRAIRGHPLSVANSGGVPSSGDRPPLPKSTPRKSIGTTNVSAGVTSKPETPARKPQVERLVKSAKASPRVTPKATPLQSPGAEIPAHIVPQQPPPPPPVQQQQQQQQEQPINLVEINQPSEPEPSTIEEEPKEEEIVENKKIEPPDVIPIKVEIQPSPVSAPAPPEVKQEVVEKHEPIGQVLPEFDEVIDMSASMRTRITTEVEAKAALAERRRLAREAAEREAELERLRLEEEARLEEERFRQEEAEQRRFEEEQLRLVEEARKAEDARLLQAIEENEKREEEEKKRKEEEARAKVEKEEAERKAKEEAEKQRKEMEERLKKEEEERIERRRRVEAIMSRTRKATNNASPATTPNKGQNESFENQKDLSPSEEQSKPLVNTSSVEEKDTEQEQLEEPSSQQQSQQQPQQQQQNNVTSKILDKFTTDLMDLQEKSKSHVVSGGSDVTLLLDNASEQRQSNGHRNGGLQLTNVDFVNVDNVQNNDNNSLLIDNGEGNLLDLDITPSTTPITGKLLREDSLNSNLPVTSYPDNTNQQHDVSDLLS